MEFDRNTIKFKSYENFYLKEEADVKNNTIRRLKYYSADRIVLEAFIAKYKHEALIEITCIETGKAFRRYIRDISFFDEWVVITWVEKLTLKLDWVNSLQYAIGVRKETIEDK